MQPKIVDLCGSFSMAQGDLTRAFSRRSKKEKERDERESMRFHELAVDLCEWRGMHGEGEGRRRTASPGEQAAPATAEREREHTNPFFPINFQEIYITHPDPNTPIQFSRTDLR